MEELLNIRSLVFIPTKIYNLLYNIKLLVLHDLYLIVPLDLPQLPVVSDELQQEIPPGQQEIFSPKLVGAAGQLGERPAGLEYLVALTEDCRCSNIIGILQ